MLKSLNQIKFQNKNEIDETIKRIEKHRGVFGFIVVNSEGKSIVFEFENG